LRAKNGKPSNPRYRRPGLVLQTRHRLAGPRSRTRPTRCRVHRGCEMTSIKAGSPALTFASAR
jgi:hypothetical protein